MQADWSQKRLVWVPAEKDGFVSASILKDLPNDVLLVKLESGKEIQVSKDEVQKMNPPKFDKVGFFQIKVKLIPVIY